MHNPPLPLILVFLVFIVLSPTIAQQGRQLCIIHAGSKVTMQAEARHARSFIWFYNDSAIVGQHDKQIVVTAEGLYTVIALGDDCHSEFSDTVEIVFDNRQPEQEKLDVEIRNRSDYKQVLLGQEFKEHLLVLNKGTAIAKKLIITFSLSPSLDYLGVAEPIDADVSYMSSLNQLQWLVAKLEPKQALSLWIRLSGRVEGAATTLAKVSSIGKDSNQADNESENTIDIISLFIPNVFTPNGDGSNDTFSIRGLDFFASNKLRIFNKYGNQIYEADNYKNDWTAQGYGDGTYFYYLELYDGAGRMHVYKSYVTVIRRMLNK